MFLHPDFTFRRVFEFPNRGDLFQFIDRPLAGAERLGPMLGPHNNQHDIFADPDFAIPMEDRDSMMSKSFNARSRISRSFFCAIPS